MLSPEDRRAIEGLFDRLAEAQHRAPDRDRDAEELIRAQISRLPSAPYYMAQTIVVQQQGLEAAEQRIQELEAKVNQQEQRSRGPWDRAADDGFDQRQPRGGGFGGLGGGGGFLGGAMQTALGVAGGVLLGSAIGSLFGAGAAQAAEGGNDASDQGGSETDQADSGADQGADQGGADDFGSGGDDFGGGDFDMGGDF